MSCGIKFPYGFPGRTNPQGFSRQTVQGPNRKMDDQNDVVDSGPRKFEVKNDSGCPVCDRAKGDVYCEACFWEGSKLRIRKICSTHPKVEFVSDLAVCPSCKTSNLHEGSRRIFSDFEMS